MQREELIEKMARGFKDAFRYGDMPLSDRLRWLDRAPLEPDESRLDREREIMRCQAALVALQPSKPYAKKKGA